MCKKFTWTLIDPLFHGFQYLTEKDVIFYKFTPFEEPVPDIVYIVDDVITSGSHFVVWKDLIHQFHPKIEVRGIYLARTVN